MKEKKFRYEQIIDYITMAIERGTIGYGRKLPSLRNMSRQFGCAVSVVMQAYSELEMRGLVRAEEKSGFFPVAAPKTTLPEPQKYAHTLISVKSKTSSITARILENTLDKSILPLGATIPDESILPVRKLKSIINRVVKESPELLCSYTSGKGETGLRSELSSLMLKRGIAAAPDEILITNGCMEALSIAVQSATDRGDTVAIESPAFFGLIALLEELDRKVIEIPTLPDSGMDLDILAAVMKAGLVRACIFTTCFQNPLGFLMPEKNRQRITELGKIHGVTLIEDDIYGECSFENRPEQPAKAYDKSGNIIYCSSLSKHISPGIRTGWMIPGKYLQKCEFHKMNRTFGGARFLQKAVSLFLKEGGYDYHLRIFRKNIVRQTCMIRQLVAEHFPEGTKISDPKGGYFLWIELPPEVDSMVFFRNALEAGIGTVPGPVFSSSGKYRNCIRISCGTPVTPVIANGIIKLGVIAGSRP
ncbi:MAG: PLP-dependent aminotransferase family protein [Spirochaetales bacterium]|nr:PLP-dependent aminotransferase family protein [Spirochaetales bacterium]